LQKPEAVPFLQLSRLHFLPGVTRMSTSSPIRPRVFLSAAWLLSASVAWGIGCTAGSDPAPGDGTGGGGANLNTRDTDGDGIVDALDPDIDNDGILNGVDPDVDGDGIPNESDPDFPGNSIGGDGDINPVDGSSGTGGGGPVTECKIVDGVEVCSCFKLITWGALGTFGAVPGQDGQDAITKWLNDNSSGEAAYSAVKPLVTADYLAPYKVLIIQDVSAWAAFTADEKAVVQDWVRTKGGGIISLNGYSANGSEMANVNDLLSFTGISYVPSTDTDTLADRTAVLGGTCQDCFGNSVPQAGWSSHPIGLSMKKVGAFFGREVSPGTATVVAQEGAKIYGAAGEYGTGRVFVFHDEWVTYNSQWTGQGAGVPDCSTRATCETQTAAQQYTIPQFWFNSLKWLSNVECFDITDPDIVK